MLHTRKLLKTISIAICLVFFTLQTNGQDSSYVRLADASGFNTNPYLHLLEKSADSLVAALPVEFQPQFKVFDFGFYLTTKHLKAVFPKRLISLLPKPPVDPRIIYYSESKVMQWHLY